MFVYNDVTRDSRVLREAATLADAGHRVTVIARPRDLASRVADREDRDGFEVLRIPVPSGWRSGWTLLRRPWRMGPWVRARCTRGMRGGFAGIGQLASGLVVGLVAGLWTVVGAPIHVLLGRRIWARGRPSNGSSCGASRSAAGPTQPPLRRPPRTSTTATTSRLCRPPCGPPRPTLRDWCTTATRSSLNRGVRTQLGRRWVRARFDRLERRWSARAEALVTVNDGVGDELVRRLRPRRLVVVHNCPPRWEAPDPLTRPAARCGRHPGRHPGPALPRRVLAVPRSRATRRGEPAPRSPTLSRRLPGVRQSPLEAPSRWSSSRALAAGCTSSTRSTRPSCSSGSRPPTSRSWPSSTTDPQPLSVGAE